MEIGWSSRRGLGKTNGLFDACSLFQACKTSHAYSDKERVIERRPACMPLHARRALTFSEEKLIVASPVKDRFPSHHLSTLLRLVE